MPLVESDLKIRLSGGAANSNVNLSLGGAKSSVEVTDDTDNNIFDDVGISEHGSGDVEFRCIYLHNGGSIPANNVYIWIDTDSSSTDDIWDIGLGSAAVNATEQTVADESTAPLDVTFTHPTSRDDGLYVSSIPAGQHKSIWYRRTVSAGATTINDVVTILKFQCDEE